MKDIKYDSSRPLMRLEKGDKATISVTLYGNESEKYMKKFKDVPQGNYEAIITEPYTLECEQYPVLSGKYTYWHGNKHGQYNIFADEIGK